jgi:hypothetical protein
LRALAAWSQREEGGWSSLSWAGTVAEALSYTAPDLARPFLEEAIRTRPSTSPASDWTPAIAAMARIDPARAIELARLHWSDPAPDGVPAEMLRSLVEACTLSTDECERALLSDPIGATAPTAEGARAGSFGLLVESR